MHANAINSLLKVIEEPQSEPIFFLTNDQEQMLPTIRSRTQILPILRSKPKALGINLTQDWSKIRQDF